MDKSKNVGLCVVLTLLTCGIYGFIWMASLANTVNELSGTDNPTSGGKVVLFSLLTCGIYAWFWVYKLGSQLDIIAQNNNKPTNNRSLIFLLLNLVGLGVVTYAIAQSEINGYLAE